MHRIVVRRTTGLRPRGPRTGPAGALVAVAATLVIPFTALADAQRWTIQPESSAAYFTVKHLMITPVRGAFYDVQGEVWIDEANLAHSKVHAVISTRRSCSGSEGRDARLQGKDFLWTSRYPTIDFRSTRIERGPDDTLMITGDLTIRGVTRSVVFEAEGPTASVLAEGGVPTRALIGRTRIDRKDFGIVWNKPLEGGGMMLSDEVSLELVLELVRPRVARDREGS